ncbi:MAG: translation initiation factor IF-2 [Tissierellia bacterium]|nr:translation initiation factor IF-2 [Tissierellia bacterium]
MNKVRVYELAKELKMTSKELVAKIKELDINISSHMSSLEKEEAEMIKELIEEERDLKKSKRNNKKIDKNERKPKKQIEMDKKETKSKDKRSGKKQEVKTIEIEDNITVRELADKIDINPTELITKLIGFGIMASINESIDYDTAAIVAEEYGVKVVRSETQESEEEFNFDYEDDPKDLKPRAPIVTVMGHVDHGKTSLLDSIRKTSVTKQEAGGITQHIGASIVNVGDKKIIFLDTPGHEAFTSMRARGTQVTDIAVLVVAADDGVMPQTIEAINHAKAANVPIIVAINKMDKPEANPDRVKQELVEHGLVPEDWGGDTITVPVSALKGQGIDELLEMILLVAEIQELKANPDRPAVGTVIEAQLDKGKGPMATVIIEKGTLHVGDIVVCGSTHGRVRAMFDDKGKNVKKAGPSIPVAILGLSEVPESGDKLYAVEDEKIAKSYAEKKKEKMREEHLKATQKVSLDDLFERIQQGEMKELNIIIKADTRGTIDALRKSLEKFESEEVRVHIIHEGVGGITESDVLLASASNAIIIGFNVRPTLSAQNMAKNEKVDIRTYRVIYEALEDIEAAIKGMLEPKLVEETIGRAEVRATFRVPNVGTVAGIYVQQGKITRNSIIRLLRNDVVVYEGKVSSLKRFKDDVREIATGYEGGLGLENFNDIKEGDILEAYIIKEVE